mgnify:CR=1 FL=1
MVETTNNQILEAIEKLSGKVGDVAEAVQTLATHVDKRFDAVDERFNKVDERVNKVDGQIGKLRSEMIDHVTRTVNNAKGDLVKEIRTERERAKLFDTRVLTILERNHLVQPEEVLVLRELVV